MKNMNLLPAFRYRLKNSLFSSGIFFGIMVLVTALLSVVFIGFSSDGARGSISSYTFSASIMSFVLGICSVREDLRLSIQHGVSRKTSFIAGICSALCIGLVLALAGEILLAVSQAAFKGSESFYVTDIFQMIYLETFAMKLSFSQHAQSLFFGLSIYICTYMAGMLISLVFYRLNKLWTVIVAVGVPVFFTVGLPLLIDRAGLWPVIAGPLGVFYKWFIKSPLSAVIFFLVCSAVLMMFSYLLVRRAPIKPAAG